MKPKNYLVTGASGFIGKRLCEVLKEQDAKCRIKGLIRHFTQGSWDETICFDLKDINQQPLPEDLAEDIDTVFHLAGIAHTRPSFSDSEENYQIVNVQATEKLLENAVKKGVKRFIYISSVKAMGQPQDAYGHSKQAAEKKVLEYGQATSLQVCILRPALIYGPGVKGNLLSMLRGIDQGWFPPLPKIDNKRSLVSVEDVVSAILMAAIHPLANGKIYTITDGEVYSTSQIYEAMRLALGKSPSRITCPLGLLRLAGVTGDFLEKLFSCRFPINSHVVEKLIETAFYQDSSIQQELGWHPKHNFFQILPSIVSSYHASRLLFRKY